MQIIGHLNFFLPPEAYKAFLCACALRRIALRSASDPLLDAPSNALEPLGPSYACFAPFCLSVCFFCPDLLTTWEDVSSSESCSFSFFNSTVCFDYSTILLAIFSSYASQSSSSSDDSSCWCLTSSFTSSFATIYSTYFSSGAYSSSTTGSSTLGLFFLAFYFLVSFSGFSSS